MKVLYIGYDKKLVKSGADQIDIRNLELLYDSIPYVKVLPVLETRSFYKRYLFGIDSLLIQKVFAELQTGDYQLVFVSQSLMGRISKHIKCDFPNIKIITFFHNIEKYYALELLRVSGFTHYLFYLAASYFEFQSVKYSDYLIVLNQRESNLLQKIYNKSADLILPTSFKDQCSKIENCNIRKEFVYLFVGAAFFANIQGIKWFISNVLPEVHGKLIIVGKGMDLYREEFASERVEVYGYVQNLSEYYSMASVVISPIFSGGGMKTKVAEAFMYGKVVVGTKEAFTGYVNCSGVMYECNNKYAFVKILNELFVDKTHTVFNSKAREIYLQEYSYESSYSKFSRWISPILKLLNK